MTCTVQTTDRPVHADRLTVELRSDDKT